MPACEADKPPKYQDCQIHARAVRDWFCIDHNIMLCSKCQDDHDKCYVKHATDMSKILSPNHLQTFEAKVTDAQEDAAAVQSELEGNVSKIEKSRTFMLKKVEKEYEKMKSQLARKFKATCDDIDKKCGDHVSSLTYKITDLSDEIQQYGSATDSIKQESKSKLDTKLFVKMQTLVENTTDSVRKVHELTKGIKSTDLDIVMDKLWKSFLSNDKQIGMVQEILAPCSLGTSLHQMSFPPIVDTMFKEIVFSEVYREPTIVIAAINIGQKSSYVFDYISNLMSDMFIQHSKYWMTPHGPKLHTPTTALIGPDGETLVAFGYEAEEEFAALVETGQSVDYYYFEKCGRHLEEIVQKTEIKEETMKDATGKSISTKHVLTLAIKYLIEDLVHIVTKKCNDIILSKKDITMVVVVPSMSTEKAKDFVKEAVIKTGISSTNIVIVSETQAVSVFCHYTLDAGKTRDSQLMVTLGDNYMIVNFHEHKVEVIIQRYTKSVPQRVQFAQFEDMGESEINEGFKSFLEDIVGKDVFQAYVKALPEDWRTMQTFFEDRKAVLDTQRYDTIRFKLTNEFFDFYERMKGQTIKQGIQLSKYSKDVEIVGDKLSVSSHIVRGFFDVPVIRSSMLLKSLLQIRKEDEIKSIFMTGNLSKMCEFQRAIKAAFPTLNLVFPLYPDLAVLKGAVILGYTSKERIIGQ